MKCCIFCFQQFDANRNVPYAVRTSGGYTKLIQGNCPGIEHDWITTQGGRMKGGNFEEGKGYYVLLYQKCRRCNYIVCADLCKVHNLNFTAVKTLVNFINAGQQ